MKALTPEELFNLLAGIIKPVTEKEVLIRLWGDKESYEKYEVLNAMIEYAVMKLEIAHQKNMEIIKEVMK